MLRNTGYIKGDSDDLFVVEQMPLSVSRNQTPVVIILQPLFEELNMARRYVNAICRELSSRGFATFHFDLSCSGDSTGECKNADWQEWGSDTIAVCRYLKEREYTHYYILAVRGGCLLIDAIRSSEVIRIDGGVLLEPTLSGSGLVTSLLRLRAYSSGFGNKLVETVSGLRRRIEDGESLEIAGTVISASLFRDIASSNYKNPVNTADSILNVIDIIAGHDNNESRSQAVSTYSTQSAENEWKSSVSGPLFWSSIEYGIDTAQVSDLVDQFRFSDETKLL